MANRYCPECGTENEGTKFCPECGNKIQEHTVTSAEADSTPESEEADLDEDSGLIITLGKIVGYIFGPIWVLLGILTLIGGSAISGLLYLTAGVISLPIVRTKLKAKQGISLSRWATVALVIVLIISGAAMVNAGDGGDGGVDPADSVDGDQDVDPADSGDNDQGQALINKPATDIVIQLDQLGSGWTERDTESNETHAVGEFFNPGDSAALIITVDKYETIDSASNDYDSRRNEIQERYGTDSVDVGDDGILYSVGDSAWVIFRDGNVVTEVQYQEEFAGDLEGDSIDYAEMVEENANS